MTQVQPTDSLSGIANLIGSAPAALASGTGIPSSIYSGSEQPLGVPADWFNQSPNSVWLAGIGPVSLSQAEGIRSHLSVGDQPSIQTVAPPPRPYMPSDVYSPANNPTEIPALQQKLIQAGLLDPTTAGYTPGLWGSSEASAFMHVLELANVNRVDWHTALDYIVQHPNAASTAAKQVTVTSPLDAQSAFMSAMESALGRKPNTKESNAFTQAWSEYERSTLQADAEAKLQQSLNPQPNAQALVGVASPSSYAQNYIETNYSGEQQGQGMLHGLGIIEQLISSSKGAGG